MTTSLLSSDSVCSAVSARRCVMPHRSQACCRDSTREAQSSLPAPPGPRSMSVWPRIQALQSRRPSGGRAPNPTATWSSDRASSARAASTHVPAQSAHLGVAQAELLEVRQLLQQCQLAIVDRRGRATATAWPPRIWRRIRRSPTAIFQSRPRLCLRQRSSRPHVTFRRAARRILKQRVTPGSFA